MSTHAEGFPARPVPTKVWIGVGAAIVLLLAIAGGMLIGRGTVEEAAPPPAPEDLVAPAVVRTVDAHIAALNAGDRVAIAAFYSEPYAVLTRDPGGEVVGARAGGRWRCEGQR